MPNNADGGEFDADAAAGAVGGAGAPAFMPLSLAGFAPSHTNGDFFF